MKKTTAVLALFATSNLSALAAPPDVPAIPRDVALVVDEQFTQPMIPAMRTSNDGRVALNLKSIGGLAFFLMNPEKISEPFLESTAGAEILSSTSAMVKNQGQFHLSTNSPGMHHVTLCDGTPQFPENNAPSNPYPCGENPANDCYDLTVVAAFIYDSDPPNDVFRTEFWGTPITVTVSSPKTALAQLSSISVGTPVLGGDFPFRAVFEPMVTEDGHLFSLRISGSSLTWFNENTGQNQTTLTDIAYSVGPETAAPCDVTQWTEFFPITHAPYHSAMQGRYGIAAYPLRDPQGYVFQDGEDIRGTYPWVDSQGANLFMTTVSSRLFWWDGVQAQTRFPIACVPGITCGVPQSASELSDFDAGGRTRGVAMAGLWTHGKVVLLDTTINNTDFGLRMPDEKHYMVDLYQPNSGPVGNEPGDVRVGTGRYNASLGQPPGSTFNTTFVDSHENLFNAKENLFPLTSRDVVWILDSGKTSDEVEFDDYVNPDVFIFSDMTMSMSFDGTLDYFDGWDGTGFTEQIRVQNAATATTADWLIPGYGLVEGDARIEPIAMGGIEGRGLWLDGNARIRYDVVAQTNPIDGTPWLFGLFLDTRFGDDTVKRDVLSFPDGSKLQIEGHDRLIFAGAGNTELASFSLGSAHKLTEYGWTHIGLLVSQAGTEIKLFVNGLALDTWTATGPEQLFRLTPGTLYVGHDPSTASGGFRGWIDQFKVIAGAPNPEVACNHAKGTLIGFPPGAQGRWANIAATYPSFAHTEIRQLLESTGQTSYATYACYHDYTADKSAHRHNLPNDAVAVRHALLFPEGPLVFGQPRPDSSGNAFCLSCHVTNHPPSLSPAALTPSVTKMEDDPRRQPLQPPRVIRGNIPANYFENGFPLSDLTAPPSGLLQDRWTAADPDDCNPDSDTIFSPPPEELENLRFASKTRIVWDGDPSNPGSAYDLIIGDLGDFPVGSGSVHCELGIPQPAEFDPAPPSEDKFYLVRGTNSCGTGGLGNDSSGAPRPIPSCGGTTPSEVPEIIDQPHP